MELVDSNHFLAWAAKHHIGRTPKYPDSTSLTFVSSEATWYRYRPNVARNRVPAFVEMAVRVAAANAPSWLYPTKRDGKWIRSDDDRGAWVGAVLEAQRVLGIPDGYVGAVHLTAGEAARAGSLVAVALNAGIWWSLAMVPDHGRSILATEEDGDLIGFFPNEAGWNLYTQALVDAGWIEPTEPD